MSRTAKRFLSLLLAATMILSLGVTGWAIDDGDDLIKVIAPEDQPKEGSAKSDTAFSGKEVELEEIDPDTLGITRLGEIDELTNEEDQEETLPYDFGDIVRVSIFLDEPATLDVYAAQNVAGNGSAMSYRSSLKAQQKQVESGIRSAGVTMDVKWNLTLAVNAISAEVRYGDIAKIQNVPGVKSVALEKQYEAMANLPNTAVTTKEMTFATNAWADGYTGAGSRIAIIDTGTNQDHLSFSAAAYLYGLEQAAAEHDVSYDEYVASLNLLTVDEIAGLADQLNAPVDAATAYKNEKIPYAYNYVDKNYTTDHDSDTQGEHGSHVSGIAAANRFVEVDGEFKDAASAVGAVGVAPDAQILTMKVFGAGGGAFDSDYMAAIEDAIVLGCDSANLSLGSGAAGFVFAGEYQKVMDNLVDSGTVVSISAGNSYDWTYAAADDLYIEDVSRHTGGSPGSFINSLGVASADNIGSVGTPLLFGDIIAFYTENTDYGNAAMTTIAGTHEFVYLDSVGTDEEWDTVGSAVEGKIALCNRGSTSFFEKANAAAKNGAIAVVIVNNQPGTINMNLQGYTYNVPAVSITLAKGQSIKEQYESSTIGELTVYTGSMEVTDKAISAVESDLADTTMSDFSSWGTPALMMKPEISAPGGNIWSVNGMTDGGYEIMGGTSMAAPQIAGMAGVLGQYIRDNDLAAKTTGNARHLINSLLMSTATPLKNGDNYWSILKQGAGLANVYAATKAMSYITMADDATISAADGKVKAELGQSLDGEYSYTFIINNFSDTDLTYAMSTDMFTQGAYEYQGLTYMDQGTVTLPATVGYIYDIANKDGHDVNKDGVTDKKDVDAILDVVSGKLAEADVDAAAGEMDGTDGLSSLDAQKLLVWLGWKEQQDAYGEELFVPAGTSQTVTVFITVDPEAISETYPNGAYVEGYTYVSCTTETDDGEILDVSHSIPILGFCGSWTDASMFESVSIIDAAYGTDKVPYVTGPNTNYLTVNYGKGNEVYFGNPYAVEEGGFPTDRLAISNKTKIVNAKYNLIRNAGTTGWLFLDAEGELLANGSMGSNAMAEWYYVNQSTWQNVNTQTAALGKKVSDLGLSEGDTFTGGFFAVPEYYAIMLDPTTKTGTISAEDIAALYKAGEIGDGAMIGYTFTIDNTAPTATAKLSEDGTKIEVTAKDNAYIAYIAVMDVSGNTAYADAVPEQEKPGEEVSVVFDISGLDLPNGVAVFVGDYAANENAYLVRIADGPIISTSYEYSYVLTDTLEAGGEYIIATSNVPGNVSVPMSYGDGYYIGVGSATVIEDEHGINIPVDSVNEDLIWNAEEVENGFQLSNKANGAYITPTSVNGRFATFADPSNYPFIYQNNLLLLFDFASYGYGMTFNNGSFYFSPAQPLYLYALTKFAVETEIDPDNASAVKVSPEAATLIMDVIPTVELMATIEPMVLPDKGIIWSSSDESVATVNENGLVTAVGNGTATIKAASHLTPDVYGECLINVTSGVPMDATIYGQVTDADGIKYAAIDLNDMSTEDISNGKLFSSFVGGGMSGSYVYGIDSDDDFHRFDMTNDFAYDSDWHYTMNHAYAPIDIAAIPHFSFTVDETTYTHELDFVGFTESSSIILLQKSSGFVFDLSSEANFIALAFVGADTRDATTPYLYYYALSAEGELYVLRINGEVENGEPTVNVNYGKIGSVNVLTIGENLTDYSMAYAGGIMEDDGVFIADNSIKGIYYINMSDEEATSFDAQFVGKIDGVKNLSSLSDGYFDTVDSLDSEAISDTLAAHFDSLLSGNVMHAQKIDLAPETESDEAGEDSYVEPDYEIVEIDDADDDVIIVDVLDGSLNAIRGVNANSSIKHSNVHVIDDISLDNSADINAKGGSSTEVIATVDLSEEKDSKNGLITMTYDPASLTFVSYESDVANNSLFVDQENGTIAFAYAAIDAVAADDTLVTIRFKLTADYAEIAVVTEELGDELDLSESNTVLIGEKPLKKGWNLEDGEWYYYNQDGTKRTNGWAKDSKGWCWLGADGKITKDKWIKDGGEWYYLKPNGYMAAEEWTSDSVGRMWMNASGKIVKNKWVKIDGEWYFLKENGYLATNEWAKDSLGTVWVDADGKIVKDKWIKVDGEWYYLKPETGYRAANEWTKDSKGWMYMDAEGKILKGEWLKYGNNWFYLQDSGYMAYSTTLTINGKDYTFDANGHWIP